MVSRPTACTSTVFNPAIQFWTSRGFAVLDVDYVELARQLDSDSRFTYVARGLENDVVERAANQVPKPLAGE